MNEIENEKLDKYRAQLLSEEKSRSTVEKYVRDVRRFAAWLEDRAFDKSAAVRYKA